MHLIIRRLRFIRRFRNQFKNNKKKNFKLLILVLNNLFSIGTKKGL